MPSRWVAQLSDTHLHVSNSADCLRLELLYIYHAKFCMPKTLFSIALYISGFLNFTFQIDNLTGTSYDIKIY